MISGKNGRRKKPLTLTNGIHPGAEYSVLQLVILSPDKETYVPIVTDVITKLRNSFDFVTKNVHYSRSNELILRAMKIHSSNVLYN